MFEQLFFIAFAGVAVLSALAVVMMRNPVHSALALMTCLFQVACLFVLLRSPFLAAVQIFIYVGAIMVLFLFVVLILDVRQIAMDAFRFRRPWVVIGVGIAIAAEIEFIVFASKYKFADLAAPAAETEVAVLGRELFTTFLFPFEVVSVVLLVAMVGAIVLTREREG